MADISSEYFTHSQDITEHSDLTAFQTDEGIFIDSAADSEEIGTLYVRLSIIEACDLIKQLTTAVQEHGQTAWKALTDIIAER